MNVQHRAGTTCGSPPSSLPLCLRRSATSLNASSTTRLRSVYEVSTKCLRSVYEVSGSVWELAHLFVRVEPAELGHVPLQVLLVHQLQHPLRGPHLPVKRIPSRSAVRYRSSSTRCPARTAPRLSCSAFSQAASAAASVSSGLLRRCGFTPPSRLRVTCSRRAAVKRGPRADTAARKSEAGLCTRGGVARGSREPGVHARLRGCG